MPSKALILAFICSIAAESAVTWAEGCPVPWFIARKPVSTAVILAVKASKSLESWAAAYRFYVHYVWQF